jgi:hypothetical protein
VKHQRRRRSAHDRSGEPLLPLSGVEVTVSIGPITTYIG